MKILSGLLVSVLSALPASAISVGDSYSQVIEEKGKPTTKMETGDVQVLNYPGQRIKLKAGKVTEIKSVAQEAAVPAPAPAPAKPAAKAQAAPDSAPSVWLTDFQAALVQAREQRTKVFMFFTGSDWCGWCKRLDAEILSTNEFKAYASQKLILLKLDFPRQIPQSDALKAQNSKLARRYHIEGYPTVIVLDWTGEKVGELHYQEGGPGPFIDALGRM